jgi:hypothetical protein
MDELNALVEKWRRIADFLDRPRDNEREAEERYPRIALTRGAIHMRECAGELEAALASPQASATGGVTPAQLFIVFNPDDEYRAPHDEKSPIWAYWKRLSDRLNVHLQPPEVCEMRLCETRFLGLRSNQLYHVTVDPNCPRCIEANKPYAPQAEAGRTAPATLSTASAEYIHKHPEAAPAAPAMTSAIEIARKHSHKLRYLSLGLAHVPPYYEQLNDAEFEKNLASLLTDIRLEEAKAIANHADRYLERDATTMELFLFIEEHLAALEAERRKEGETR